MRKITFATLLLPMLLQASSYYCQTNNGTYSDSTLCASACGGTACQTLDPLSSGGSGACDTTKYSYFVSDGKKTYGISKASGFWTDFSSLAIPTDSSINTLVASLSKYSGQTAWIGAYDPLKSSSYNSVTPSRFTDSNGLSLLYLNWASGQPDNKLDNTDIGITPINGEQWAYMQNDGTWGDDGYHASYGGSYKPMRPAIVEWNGPLDCVNGTPPATTSNSSGHWCSDGSTQAQCTASIQYVAMTSTTQYTAMTGGTSTYVATATTTGGLTYDNCEGGYMYLSQASIYCQSKGMRLPTQAETLAGGGCVPSCPSVWTWAQTWTSTFSSSIWVWSGSSLYPYYSGYNHYMVRCVK